MTKFTISIELEYQQVRAAAVRAALSCLQGVIAGILVPPIAKAVVEVIHLVIRGTKGIMSQVGDVTT